MKRDKDRLRFEKNFTRTDGCWFWKDAKGKYGSFSLKGKRSTAHRFSYAFYKGAIPEGLFVCHHCDNPKCVNPDHLFLGTQKDNLQDASKKKRLVGNRIYKSMLGRKHDKESIQKMSDAKRGNKYHFGRTHSNTTKQLLSNMGKGKKASEETVQKMRKAQTGRKHSEETKKKMSVSAKKYLQKNRRNISDETRKKISDAGIERWKRKKIETNNG